MTTPDQQLEQIREILLTPHTDKAALRAIIAIVRPFDPVVSPARKTRRSINPGLGADLSTMSDVERFAHYKQTAPVYDCRFFEAAIARQFGTDHPLYDKVRALAIDAPTLSRADVYKRLVMLQAEWRQTRNPAADRAFEAMHAYFAQLDELRGKVEAFKRGRRDLVEQITERSTYRNTPVEQLAIKARDLVRQARETFPRLSALGCAA